METVEKAKPTLAANRKAVAKYAAKNKEKIKHKSKVQNAERSGKIKKPSSCSKCGRSGIRLSFHHSDTKYKDGSELKGRYLCDSCHRNLPHHKEKHRQGQLNKD